LKNKMESFRNKPIPECNSWNWEQVRSLRIEESGEPLVQTSLTGGKLTVSPQYFLQGIDGALPECFLRKGAFVRLHEAAENLPDIFKIVIMDAWRPEKVQESLFVSYREELKSKCPGVKAKELEDLTARFVAHPSSVSSCPSPHITGGAVDISMVDQRGLFLEMGTIFDQTSETSQTCYYEKKLAEGIDLNERESSALENRRILYHTMINAGFTNYPEEWWHFDYGNQNWAYLSKSQDVTAFYGVIHPFLRWKKNF